MHRDSSIRKAERTLRGKNLNESVISFKCKVSQKILLPIVLPSMAAENEEKISLKLVVDKERNRVVFAESGNDFVEILFSFLTIPLGTIVRLLGKQSQPVEIGSLTSLYKGVADFDTEHLWNETCKTMLLHPNNSAETLRQKLKLDIDDTEPTKYFVCNSFCNQSGSKSLSTRKDMRCSCGQLMNVKLTLKDLDINGGAGGDSVFVDAKANFIISDDLQVMPTSSSTMCALLNNLGISNVNVLYTRSLNVGLQEISRILELSLVSRSPMTDMFLREQVIQPRYFELKHESHLQNGGEASESSSFKKITVKLILRKSDNMILYAEAGEDFVDLLFSFLTLPLGLVEELSSGKTSLGCIDNLYKSVGDMNVDRYLRSEYLKSMLLQPKLSPHFSWQNQPSDVKEVNPVPYLCNRKSDRTGESYLTFNKRGGLFSIQLNLIDPKPPTGSSTSTGGYVKGPAMFMVTDNLLVQPLSSIWCIDYLNKLNVPISNLEERVIHVGKEEALCLLKASLVSQMALNVGLNLMLNKARSTMFEAWHSVEYSLLLLFKMCGNWDY